MSVMLDYYTPSETILSQKKNECYKSILSEIKKYKPNCQWIQLEENVQINDLTIVRGGFYMGNYFEVSKILPKQVTYKSTERIILGAVINPQLSFKEGKYKNKYFFSYYNMTEVSRYLYLLWLSRQLPTEEVPIDILLLYVYGIQVRLFIDQETSVDEKEQLVRALVNLKTEFTTPNIVTSYINRVVDRALSLYFVHRIDEFNLSGICLEECGKILFVEAASDAKSINADIALYLFERIYPNYFHPTIRKTVYNYFRKRYRSIRLKQDTYTHKEDVAIPHELGGYTYFAPETLKYTICALKTKIEVYKYYNLRESYYQLLRDFRKYDTIAHIVKCQLSPFAYFSLPSYVQDQHEDALVNIKNKIGDIIEANRGIIKASDLLDLWEIVLDDCQVVPKKILDSLLDNMSQLDYGMIPNYTYGHKRLSFDTTCVLYKLKRSIVSPSYLSELEAFLKALSIVLRASQLSAQDYDFIEECLQGLVDSEFYHNHLRAYIIWLLQEKQTFDVKSKAILSTVSTESKQRYLNLLLMATSVSGNIDVKRVDALKKILPTFDVDADSVHIMLHHVLTDDMGFATVEKHGEAKEFTIRRPGPKKVKVELDQRKLDKFKEQTSIAQDLLSGIFAIEDEVDSVESSSLDNSMLSILKKLLQREVWTREEVQQMCGPNVMIGNLLEQINDYAYEKVEDVVVDEDDDMIYIMTEYKDQLI